VGSDRAPGRPECLFGCPVRCRNTPHLTASHSGNPVESRERSYGVRRPQKVRIPESRPSSTLLNVSRERINARFVVIGSESQRRVSWLSGSLAQHPVPDRASPKPPARPEPQGIGPKTRKPVQGRSGHRPGVSRGASDRARSSAHGFRPDIGPPSRTRCQDLRAPLRISGEAGSLPCTRRSSRPVFRESHRLSPGRNGPPHTWGELRLLSCRTRAPRSDAPANRKPRRWPRASFSPAARRRFPASILQFWTR
jgi:hypothetical protein